jgi:hypothetical protein
MPVIACFTGIFSPDFACIRVYVFGSFRNKPASKKGRDSHRAPVGLKMGVP